MKPNGLVFYSDIQHVYFSVQDKTVTAKAAQFCYLMAKSLHCQQKDNSYDVMSMLNNSESIDIDKNFEKMNA